MSVSGGTTAASGPDFGGIAQPTPPRSRNEGVPMASVRPGPRAALRLKPQNKRRRMLSISSMFVVPARATFVVVVSGICPLLSEGTMLPPTTTACVDLSPPIGAARYYVVAVDRNSSGAMRDGDRRIITIGPPSPRPSRGSGSPSRSTARAPRS